MLKDWLNWRSSNDIKDAAMSDPLAPVSPARVAVILFDPQVDRTRGRRADLYDAMLGYHLHPALPR